MTNFSSICLFFLLLILANEVAGIAGRKVELGKKSQTAAMKVMSLAEEGQESDKNPTHYPKLSPRGEISSTVASPSKNGGQISAQETGDVDAFRPTTPGHSPGIGHSSIHA